MRALEYLRAPSRIWAIEEGAWREMVEIARGENPSLESIEAALGKTLNNGLTNQYEVKDGVAIIPVIGPIMKYGNIFSSVSGAVSLSSLAANFNKALEDDKVNSVLFHIDSPGGEANGVNEFAESIYESRDKKPLVAYISGQGCSAAYWIASACEKIYIDDMASAGSIGVFVSIQDTTEKDEKDGVKTYKFVSSGSENKRPDLSTKEGHDVIAETINAMGNIFKSKVARNRSTDETQLSPKDVVEKFNRGGTLVGKQAVKAGLADGLSSFDKVLENLISAKNKNVENTNSANASNGDNTLIFEVNLMNENTNMEAVNGDSAADVPAYTTEQITTLTMERNALESQVADFITTVTNLEAQLATVTQERDSLQDSNLVLEAEAWVAGKGGKITPARHSASVSAYVQAAKDDIANPISGKSRLDTFKEMWATSSTTDLTEEVLSPDNIDLASEIVDEDADDMAELINRAKAYATTVNTQKKTSARA